MDLRRIVGQLASLTGNGVSHYREGKAHFTPYPQLYRDVSATVQRLRDWGVEPGMRVALLAANSYEWIVHDLALIELRCVAIGLPDELLSDGLEELAKRFDLSLLLNSRTDSRIDARISWVAHLDAAHQESPRLRTRIAPAEPDPEYETVAIAFSSASTGRVKGMFVSRSGVEVMLTRLAQAFEVSARDALLAFLPLSGFQQRMMVYCAIAFGFNLQLATPQMLFEALRDFRPTMFIAPPLFYERVAQRVRNQPKRLQVLLAASRAVSLRIPHAGLRMRWQRLCYRQVDRALGGRIRGLLTGMAPIQRSVLELFHDMGLPLYETYGLTECGTVTCNVPGANRIGSVGRPLGQGEVFLADDGEILVRRTSQLTHGYVDVPESQASNTYRSDNVIATGDIGRFDADGYLYLTGRKKDIIITSGGHKIHPELLEARIAECPAVERAVVFGGPGFPTLVALVALPAHAGEQERARVERFIAQLNQDLPAFSVVGRTVFTTVSFTPDNGLLTANLKLARAEVLRRFESELRPISVADAEPERSAAGLAAASGEAALSEHERILREIWCDVLGRERIGVNESFFELAGDSILAIRIIDRAQQAGLLLTVNQLLLHPTIRQLASVVGMTEAVSAEQGRVTGAVSLTPAQHFVLDRDGDPSQFCTSMLFKSSEPLIAPLLERAVQRLVEHHDALRLALHKQGTSWIQEHRDPRAIDIVVETQVTPHEQSAGEENACVLRARTELDLGAGRNLAVRLLESENAEETRLLLTIHSSVVDGVSWPILIEDLCRVYGQLAAGNSPHLLPKTSAYQAWADRQRQLAHSDALRSEIGYWLEQPWSRTCRLPLGTACSTTPQRSIRSVRLGSRETAQLLRGARALGLGVHTVLLGAALCALRAVVGASEIAVLLESHGRDLEDGLNVMRTVGSFVSIFPAIFDLSGAQDVQAAARAVHSKLESIPGRGRGFGLLRYLSEDPAAVRLRELPRPDFGFNYRGVFPEGGGLLSLCTRAGAPDTPAVWEQIPQVQPLQASGQIIGGCLRFDWEYVGAAQVEEPLARIEVEFTRALKSLVDRVPEPKNDRIAAPQLHARTP